MSFFIIIAYLLPGVALLLALIQFLSVKNNLGGITNLYENTSAVVIKAATGPSSSISQTIHELSGHLTKTLSDLKSNSVGFLDPVHNLYVSQVAALQTKVTSQQNQLSNFSIGQGTILHVFPPSKLSNILCAIIISAILLFAGVRPTEDINYFPVGIVTCIYLLTYILILFRDRMILQGGQLFSLIENNCSHPFTEKVAENRIIETLARIDEHTRQLESALTRHKEAVEKMPLELTSALQKEVREGIQPLRQTLQETLADMQKTQLAFQSLLSHIPGWEAMPEWLMKVENTIKPIELAGNTILMEKEKSNGLIQETGKLIQDYMKQRNSMEEVSLKVGEGISEWITVQSTQKDDMNSYVKNQMSLLNRLNTDMRDQLGELSGFSKKTETLIKQLNERMPDAVENIEKLSGNQLQASKNLNAIISQLHEVSTKLNQPPSNMDKVIKIALPILLVILIIATIFSR